MLVLLSIILILGLVRTIGSWRSEEAAEVIDNGDRDVPDLETVESPPQGTHSDSEQLRI